MDARPRDTARPPYGFRQSPWARPASIRSASSTLFMGGYWEFTFTITEGTNTESAQFSFCLEG